MREDLGTRMRKQSGVVLDSEGGMRMEAKNGSIRPSPLLALILLLCAAGMVAPSRAYSTTATCILSGHNAMLPAEHVTANRIRGGHALNGIAGSDYSVSWKAVSPAAGAARDWASGPPGWCPESPAMPGPFNSRATRAAPHHHRADTSDHSRDDPRPGSRAHYRHVRGIRSAGRLFPAGGAATGSPGHGRRRGSPAPPGVLRALRAGDPHAAAGAGVCGPQQQAV